MSKKGYSYNVNTKRSKMSDQDTVDLSSGNRKSNLSSTYKSDFNIPGFKSTQNVSIIDYDNMELNQHLVDLWVVLRRIAKIVFIATLIVLVLPGYENGTLAINPYKPAVLQILNFIIGYSINSLSSGGDVQVFVGSPLTPIMFYLNLGAFIAVLVSLPIIIRELMSFIRPGLTDKEWQILKNLSKMASVLFLIGSFISYFIIMPITLKVLAITGGVVGNGRVLQMYSLESVLNLLLWGTLGGGLLYASPVILLALVNLEIMTPDQIVNRKREINFAIFTIAAFVTPDPTIVSMLILSIPMVLVVEFIITVAFKIELQKILGDEI